MCGSAPAALGVARIMPHCRSSNTLSPVMVHKLSTSGSSRELGYGKPVAFGAEAASEAEEGEQQAASARRRVTDYK